MFGYPCLLVLAYFTDYSLSVFPAGSSPTPTIFVVEDLRGQSTYTPSLSDFIQPMACQPHLYPDDSHVDICSHNLSADLQTLRANCQFKVSSMSNGNLKT